MEYTKQITDQMQDEVLALMQAWSDRGIPPDDGAALIAGISHAVLATAGLHLGEVVKLLVQQWEIHGGKL